MKFFSKVWDAIHTRTATYVFFVLSALAYVFLNGATWSYSWIAQLYPGGSQFVPTMLGVIIAVAAVHLVYLLYLSFTDRKKKSKLNTALKIIHTIFILLSIVLFVYTLVLVFGLDSGISSDNIARGFEAIAANLVIVILAFVLPLALLFCESPKKALRGTIAAVVVGALAVSPMLINSGGSNKWDGDKIAPYEMQSENLMEGASIVYESLKQDEKPDAAALLEDNDDCWTPQDPNRMPADSTADINNSYVEIQLAQTSTFNTAVIEEVGNEAQYFRLQALQGEEWVTIYQSEKIQTSRLCSFDAVTTDRIRLSIDKFRSTDTTVKIRSIQLYNEPVRDAKDFEVTAYQRLDGDVPTEILAKGEEYVNNYARFYDVYSTVIVFGATHWQEDGTLGFGEGGEEKFAREVEALKEIIAHRSNPDHEVKLIITALADGTWGEGHNGVNGYMAENWETVADQIVEFLNKYDFDGVDIDWEYPQTPDDWKTYDQFIARLDDGMHETNPDAILTAALSAGSLGMAEETLDRFDQIQFMAYDGSDEDGYQSSLQQAQEGMKAFIDAGADISKINIGIAAYGRPVNGTPYWGTWRDLADATYWNNKYFTVYDSDQVYEGTFCSPALAGDKTAYALFSGAGGVMVFRVACDKTMDDPNSVACGIENALKRYVANW